MSKVFAFIDRRLGPISERKWRLVFRYGVGLPLMVLIAAAWWLLVKLVGVEVGLVCLACNVAWGLWRQAEREVMEGGEAA